MIYTKELSEEKLHRKLCQYLKGYYPSVYFISDPSGIRLGQSNWKVKSLLKSTSSNHKHLDIHILEPSKEFIGLIIECKLETPFKNNGELKSGEHLEMQKLIMDALESKGYRCSFVWDFNQGIALFENYLENPVIDNTPLF